jgi:mono/diheme cytochrome c family protein
MAVMRSLAVATWVLSIGALCSCARVGDEPRGRPEARPALAAAVPAVSTPARLTSDPRLATRRAAHDVLAEHCGECHEGHRPTAVAKALAVFDLDQPDWPARFDAHRYQAALMRLSKKPGPARDAFIAFRDAELAVGRTASGATLE